MVGSYFKSVLEYAGLGGDTSYMKSETQASISNTFAEGWVRCSPLTTGLVPWIQDRSHENPGWKSSLSQ